MLQKQTLDMMAVAILMKAQSVHFAVEPQDILPKYMIKAEMGLMQRAEIMVWIKTVCRSFTNQAH
jgi:hypothetical protein